MPILDRESSIYPELLLENSETSCAEERWWVVYTKSRQEKALARRLLALQIPFYLPLVAKGRFIRGRKVHCYLPVFPGYVFLRANEEGRQSSLTTNRISRILPVADEHQLVTDLQQLKRLIGCDAPLTIERRLRPGRRVRVKAGSLVGLEGTITARRASTRLFVAVDYLQQGASIEIDDCVVEPID